jgi:hypothetical protein
VGARIAILNGFGRSLGDGIIGLQALHAASERGVLPARPVLFRLPGVPRRWNSPAARRILPRPRWRGLGRPGSAPDRGGVAGCGAGGGLAGGGMSGQARVKTGIWVTAALRLGNAAGRYGAVLRKGDEDAGGVLVVLRAPHGVAVLSQTYDAAGAPAWIRGTGKDPVGQEAADSYVARQVKFDPDLWVLDFDSPDLLPPFEARIL